MLSREVSGARAEQRRLVDAPPDLETLAQVADRYGLTFEFESIERIMRDHGLVNL
jgi:hypothetical protein